MDILAEINRVMELEGRTLAKLRAAVGPAYGKAVLMIYACPTPMGTSTLEAVMLAPPLTIADAELDEVVAILADALAATA